MKFDAADRMKVFPDPSKKAHGLSLARSENVGGAKVPENAR
jgi:hypothetical protein